MHVLAVHSLKGGVGKTAAAVNLGYLAAASGRRVLLWDLDPQAASTFYLRVQPAAGGARRILRGKRDLEPLIRASDYERLHLLPARFSFRHADAELARQLDPGRQFRKLIRPFEKDYDLLLFDCAPGFTTLSESVLAASAHALVPVIPTPLSLRALQAVCEHLNDQKGPTVQPFFSMVDRRKLMHRSITGTPESLARLPLDSMIPYASQVEQMGRYRAPVHTFAGGCAAARAFASLWNEVEALLSHSAPVT